MSKLGGIAWLVAGALYGAYGAFLLAAQAPLPLWLVIAQGFGAVGAALLAAETGPMSVRLFASLFALGFALQVAGVLPWSAVISVVATIALLIGAAGTAVAAAVTRAYSSLRRGGVVAA